MWKWMKDWYFSGIYPIQSDKFLHSSTNPVNPDHFWSGLTGFSLKWPGLSNQVNSAKCKTFYYYQIFSIWGKVCRVQQNTKMWKWMKDWYFFQFYSIQSDKFLHSVTNPINSGYFWSGLSGLRLKWPGLSNKAKYAKCTTFYNIQFFSKWG